MSRATSASSNIAGLTAAPSKLVNVPRVAESPVSFECKLTQIIQLQGADGKKAQAWLTLGEVVAVHIDKAMIKDGVYQTGTGAPDRARRPPRRLFRDQAGRHVRDDPAGLIQRSLRESSLRTQGPITPGLNGEKGRCSRATTRVLAVWVAAFAGTTVSPEPMPHCAVITCPAAGSISLYFQCEVSSDFHAFLLD